MNSTLKLTLNPDTENSMTKSIHNSNKYIELEINVTDKHILYVQVKDNIYFIGKVMDKSKYPYKITKIDDEKIQVSKNNNKKIKTKSNRNITKSGIEVHKLPLTIIACEKYKTIFKLENI